MCGQRPMDRATSATSPTSTTLTATTASTASAASCASPAAGEEAPPPRQLPTTRAASGVDFFTQLAYPLSELDAQIKECRDDGKTRRRLVHAALAACTSWQSDETAVLAAANQVLSAQYPDARVCLVGVRVRRAQRSEAGREGVIAVQQDAKQRCVFVDPALSPREGDEATGGMRAVIVLHRRDRNTGATTRLEIAQPASNTMRLSLMTRAPGADKGWVPKEVVEGCAEASVLADMFAPMAESLPPRLVPIVQGDLPEVLMAHIADFWQRCVRAHLLVEHRTARASSRIERTCKHLVFESMTVRRDPRRQNDEVLRCTLHESCFRSAGDGSTELLLITCGRARSCGGACDRHVNPPDFDIAPTTCCANLRAELVCPRNATVQIGLNADAQNRAAALVDAVMRFGDAMVKVNNADLQERRGSALQSAGEQVVVRLERALARLPSLPREDVMCARDILARELLQRDASAGVVRRTAATMTRKPSLAWYASDGSRQGLRVAKYTGVIATHSGLFPPPPDSRSKRGRA